MATNNNVTGSYSLSKKSRVSHYMIFITACAQNVRLQHERKHVDSALPVKALRCGAIRYYLLLLTYVFAARS